MDLQKLFGYTGKTVVVSGAFDWQSNVANYMAAINAETYEDAIAWYESYPARCEADYMQNHIVIYEIWIFKMGWNLSLLTIDKSSRRVKTCIKNSLAKQ